MGGAPLFALLFAAVASLEACGPVTGGALAGLTEPPPPPKAVAGPELVAAPDAEQYEFSRRVSGREADTGAQPELEVLRRSCPERDGALERVARRVARRHARGLPALETPEIVFALRAEGSPHVWPRAWALEGASPDNPEAPARLERFLTSFDDGGRRRCGVAYVAAGQGRALAAVALDALAELEPMPTRARTGTWLELRARLLVEAIDPQFVVLPPDRPPQSLLASADGAHVRARFLVDRPGVWLWQLVASTARGPRPVLESFVYVDERPPQVFLGTPAPGEEHAARELPAADSLERMVQAVRRRAGLAALRRDTRLDSLAETHADGMRRAGRLAHDLGEGDPRRRLESEGLGVLAAGENVAHAASVERAHRALWSSPSHRANLLHPRFDAIGIGAVTAPDGSVWVCQLFADFR